MWICSWFLSSSVTVHWMFLWWRTRRWQIDRQGTYWWAAALMEEMKLIYITACISECSSNKRTFISTIRVTSRSRYSFMSWLSCRQLEGTDQCFSFKGVKLLDTWTFCSHVWCNRCRYTVHCNTVILKWRVCRLTPHLMCFIHWSQIRTQPRWINPADIPVNHKVLTDQWNISFNGNLIFRSAAFKTVSSSWLQQNTHRRLIKSKTDITKSLCGPRIRRKHFCGLQKCTLPTFILASVSERRSDQKPSDMSHTEEKHTQQQHSAQTRSQWNQ